MIPSITQYDLLSTSTCTSIGAGGSQCVYTYRKEISTTTTPNLPFAISTSTANYEAIATVQSLILIGMIFAVLTAYIVRKLT